MRLFFKNLVWFLSFCSFTTAVVLRGDSWAKVERYAEPGENFQPEAAMAMARRLSEMKDLRKLGETAMKVALAEEEVVPKYWQEAFACFFISTLTHGDEEKLDELLVHALAEAPSLCKDDECFEDQALFLPETLDEDTPPWWLPHGCLKNNNLSFRDRLEAFYKKHNPDKLKIVDQAVEQFKDDEESLWVMLFDKYGEIDESYMGIHEASCRTIPVEDGSSAGNMDCSAMHNMSLKERLTLFYENHNPDKLKIVDQAVQQYKDNEESLWVMLFDKYHEKAEEYNSLGVDVLTEGHNIELEREEWEEAYLEAWNAFSQGLCMDRYATKFFASQLEKALNSAKKRFQRESLSLPNEWKKKSETLEKLLNVTEFPEWFCPDSESRDDSSPDEATFRARLRAFYEYWNPPKVDLANFLARQFFEDEEALWKLLAKKYPKALKSCREYDEKNKCMLYFVQK
eukprot:g3388.t1